MHKKFVCQVRFVCIVFIVPLEELKFRESVSRLYFKEMIFLSGYLMSDVLVPQIKWSGNAVRGIFRPGQRMIYFQNHGEVSKPETKPNIDTHTNHFNLALTRQCSGYQRAHLATPLDI
jgi:hypothetical protein